MRVLLGALAAVGLFGGLMFVAGKALGLWDPIEPAPPPPPRWTTYETARFSIELPPSWERLEPSKHADVVTSDPAFAKFVRQVQRIGEAKMGFHAFDASQPSRIIATRDHVVTNVGVTTARVSVSAKEAWRRDRRDLAKVPNRVGPMKEWHVRIDGRPALKLRTRFRVRSPLGAKPVLSMTQWSVVSRGYEYVLTYVTSEVAEASYMSTFDRSAASFTLASVSKPKNRSKPDLASFRERVNNICGNDIPDFVMPLTSLGHARARARVYSGFVRDLRRVHAPKAARANYATMVGAVNDLLFEVQGEVAAISGNLGAQAITNAVADATQASARARTYARKLHLGWCADSLAGAA
jgi:hypothetical protein